MIINIKHKNDLITIDLRLKEIRYLINTKKEEMFKSVIWDSIKLSNNDIEGLEFLNKNSPKTLLKSVCSILKDNGYKIKIKDLEVLN